ncbi:MAG: DUF456 domain-containing protein [Arenimonas sp.]|jgi:uncharacterized protein YqgC (DUF456 family)|uniref:DUF456 domain-containing protein n=1 Tax=Arenimonas sp. TaxID=1872635 RepID=UPI003C055E4D
MTAELQQILYIISAALIIIGLLGVFLPILPGIPLAYAGMVLAAWAGGFKEISVLVLILLGLLTLASVAIDFLASALGAKRAGASKLAVVGAALGSLIGMIFFNLPGLILGPFVGVMAVETAQGRSMREAGKIGFATWIGMAVGVALKVGLAFAMMGIFLFALWF